MWYFSLRRESSYGGGIWRVIIAVGVAALIAALTAVVLIRIRELKGEDENDYRKY